MIKKLFQFWHREDGNAAIEAAMLMPLMLVILFGMVDVGTALLVNKKLITATQMTSDLLGREQTISDAELEDAIAAAEMAMMPYDATALGVDIAGIRFVGGGADPTVEWRETRNMTENADVLIESDGLGRENEGVIAVTMEYSYQPFFSSIAVGDIVMQEVAYVRGRSGTFVRRE